MKCNNHGEIDAIGSCTYCGKAFCFECLIDVNGRNYCREHVGMAVETSANQQPTIIINNENANTNANTNYNAGNMGNISFRSRTVALLLCIFLGVFGGHHFYAGRFGMGILYLFTAGLCGIGVIVDFIRIILGSYRDNFGNPIINW